jgi:hypothetical protein
VAVLLAIYIGNGQRIDADSFERPVIEPKSALGNPPVQ